MNKAYCECCNCELTKKYMNEHIYTVKHRKNVLRLIKDSISNDLFNMIESDDYDIDEYDSLVEDYRIIDDEYWDLM